MAAIIVLAVLYLENHS
ncbi:TPA: hypothetical protein ACNTBT_001722 [Escherichia coli]